MKPFGAVIQKEARHIWRDKTSMITLFFLPAIIVCLFGFVLSFDIQEVPIAVFDKSSDTSSRGIIEKIDNSQHFQVVRMIHSPQEIHAAFARNDVRAVLVLPELDLFVDYSDPNVSIAIESALHSLLNESGNHPYIRVLYNEDLRKEVMPIPGLIMIIFILVSSVMLSITINKEKEQGTIRLLVLTPLSVNQLVTGKSLPYFIISFFHIASVWFISYHIFNIRIAGSSFLFFILCLLFALTAMAFGLLIAAWFHKQLEVFLFCWLVFFIPNVFLSGFIFPILTLPPGLQLIARCIPGTSFIEGYRGIVLKGTGLQENFLPILSLVIQLIVMSACALWGYSRRFIKK